MKLQNGKMRNIADTADSHTSTNSEFQCEASGLTILELQKNPNSSIPIWSSLTIDKLMCFSMHLYHISKPLF